MAIIQLSALVGSISGNVGGASFANSKSGPVVRQPRRPTHNASATQDAQQVNLLTQINRWRDLSALDRAAWNAAGAQRPFTNRLGIARPLTGYQYFLKLNLNVEIDLPPDTAADTTAVTITFQSSIATEIDIIFTGIPPFTDYEGFLYGQLLYRDTPIAFNRDWRALGLVNTGGTLEVPIGVQWQTVFTLPILNQFIALQFRPFAGGADLGGWTTQILQTTA